MSFCASYSLVVVLTEVLTASQTSWVPRFNEWISEPLNRAKAMMCYNGIDGARWVSNACATTE